MGSEFRNDKRNWMTRNKNPFFCRWKYPKWPKSCFPRLGTSWPRKQAAWRRKSRRMFVSLVFVKCLSDETYIFLADIDIQWKLPTTEENANIQLEAISKMCSFWVYRSWIKPKQRQQQSCAKQLSALLAWLAWRRSFQNWMVSTFMCQ